MQSMQEYVSDTFRGFGTRSFTSWDRSRNRYSTYSYQTDTTDRPKYVTDYKITSDPSIRRFAREIDKDFDVVELEPRYMPTNVLGFTFVTDWTRAPIFLDKSLSYDVKRFVLAHEMAHHKLHQEGRKQDEYECDERARNIVGYYIPF